MNIHYSLDSYEFYNKISEVIILDIIPCKSFPIIYGFIDIFSFDVILITCNRIDIPPKPNKKEAIIMLILENLNKERLFSPLVNSTIPISIEESISLEIPNKPNNGANMLEVSVKIWLFSNMEHTTEKRTTKPPTTRMELILLDTLFDKISPKFEKETHLGWGYVEEKTGDYVCTQCGQDFTKNEYDRIIAERNKNQQTFCVWNNLKLL